MIESKEHLLRDFYSGAISKDSFIHQYFDGPPPDDEYCLKMLKNAVTMESSGLVQETLTVANALNCFSNKYSGTLCQLLISSWHFCHEDIANTLKALKDPTTANCLYEATHLRLAYLEYDDTYQFARKCIKALAAINNNEAIENLKLLTQSEVIPIQTYATKELTYKGLL